MKRLELYQIPVLHSTWEWMKQHNNDAQHTDIDHILSQIHKFVSEGNGAVFVDDDTLPKEVLTVLCCDSLARPGKIAVIGLIYVAKEKRTPVAAQALVDAGVAFAREKQCYAITMSEWVFGDATQGVGALWEKCGFRKQEVIYRKDL